MAEKEKGGAKDADVQEHANIFAALSAFQGELKPMKRSGHVKFATKGGEVDFKYTPLSEIMEVIYPLLAKHGLSVRHEIVRGGALGTKEGVEAILTHSTYKRTNLYRVDGAPTISEVKPGDDAKAFEGAQVDKLDELVEGELRSGAVFISQAADMKETGGAITYARRYTLTMLLGISSEDDLDAELFEDRAANAMGFAYTKAEQGIRNAKTVADLDKATKIIADDLKKLEAGKAGALGLDKAQYEQLLKMGEDRKKELQDASQAPGTPGKLID